MTSRTIPRRALLGALLALSGGCTSTSDDEDPTTVPIERCVGTADPTPSGDRAGGWPQYGNDAQATHGTSDRGPDPPLQIDWEVREDAIRTWVDRDEGHLWDPSRTPIAVDGRVYFASAGGLHAVDAETGTHLWSCREPIYPNSDILWANGTIACISPATDSPGPGGIFGVDPEERAVEWRRTVDGIRGIGPFDGDWLYVQTSRGPRRLDPSAGEFEAEVIRGRSEPLGEVTLARNGLVVSVSGRTITVVDASGTVQTQTTVAAPSEDIPGRYVAEPVAMNDSTLLASYAYHPPEATASRVGGKPTVTEPPAYEWNGTVVAVDLDTGERTWSHGIEGSVGQSLAVGNGVIYVVGYVHRLTSDAARARGFVEAVDAARGCRIWRTLLPTGEIPEMAPALASDRLYIISYGFGGRDEPPGVAMSSGRGGAIRTLDARSGERLGSYSLDGVESRSAPAVADGRLFLTLQRATGGTVVAGLGPGET